VKSYELLGAFVLFAVVASFTPGPNNVMLMTSGLNFGVQRAQAHAFGVSIGFAFMVLVVGVGLGALFTAWPLLYQILKYAGVAYLLYLAWLIARAHGLREGEKRSRPITFLQAAAFQWINPKGWVMIVGAVTSFTAFMPYPGNVLVMAAIFGLLCIASAEAWILFGSSLRRIVTNDRAVRIFNITMAFLLVASIIPVLVE